MCVCVCESTILQTLQLANRLATRAQSVLRRCSACLLASSRRWMRRWYCSSGLRCAANLNHACHACHVMHACHARHVTHVMHHSACHVTHVMPRMLTCFATQFRKVSRQDDAEQEDANDEDVCSCMRIDVALRVASQDQAGHERASSMRAARGRKSACSAADMSFGGFAGLKV